MSDFQPDAYPNCDPYANLNPTSFYTADSNTDFDIHLALTGRQGWYKLPRRQRLPRWQQLPRQYWLPRRLPRPYRLRRRYRLPRWYWPRVFCSPLLSNSRIVAYASRVDAAGIDATYAAGAYAAYGAGANASGPMQLMRPGQSCSRPQCSNLDLPLKNISLRLVAIKYMLLHEPTCYSA